MGAWADWSLTLKNIFLPMFCRMCGARLLTEENGFFCPTCWELSPRVRRPFCTVCGRPHKGAIGFGTSSNFPCADCRERGERPFRRIYGAAYYAEAVEEAIKLFKFHDKPQLARPLGELMARFAEEELELDGYDRLVPVPLHHVRERDRGYNQSRLLALELAPCFPRARLDESLRRVRPTRTQSRMVLEAERLRNIAGAFAVEEGVDLRGQTVLLIDDVVTSSGTVAECAKALRKAGAAAVDVLALALAVMVPDEMGNRLWQATAQTFQAPQARLDLASRNRVPTDRRRRRNSLALGLTDRLRELFGSSRREEH